VQFLRKLHLFFSERPDSTQNGCSFSKICTHRLFKGGFTRMNEAKPREVSMTYKELKNYFRAAERNRQHLTGYIVFSPASFIREYSLESRTYVVSSDNKAFQPRMGGYSIFASSMDGSDQNIRLEQYMSTEHGGRDGWQIER
jgi:hypothetical protein